MCQHAVNNSSHIRFRKLTYYESEKKTNTRTQDVNDSVGLALLRRYRDVLLFSVDILRAQVTSDRNFARLIIQGIWGMSRWRITRTRYTRVMSDAKAVALGSSTSQYLGDVEV
jgi:hypothetical protein